MTLGHEKLDVYQLSIGYVAWVYKKVENTSLNWITSQRCSAVWVEETMASRKVARLTEKLISIPISIPIPIWVKDLKDGLCCNKSTLEPNNPKNIAAERRP